MNRYDEDYFERGVATCKSGYSNFRWIPELTIPMCARLSEKLQIKDEDTILDFGCAKGFVVKAFRLIGKKCWGVDISDYALSQADNEIKPFLFKDSFDLQNGKPYDWIISKDVFEHISYEQIDETLNHLFENCNSMFCCFPLGNNGKYVVKSYEMDVTHIIRENLNWWRNKFLSVGFEVDYAEYHFDNLKQNYSGFEKGNGFFILRR